MAVRIADTLKQQNNLTTFPVAYGEDIWLDENKGSGTANYDSLQNLYNDGKLGGSSIQVETMPAASASNVGKIVQYIGATGSYEHGCFYECKDESGSYVWRYISTVKNGVFYTSDNITDSTIYPVGSVAVYTGEPLWGLFKGHHYEYVEDTPLTTYKFNGTKNGETLSFFLANKELKIGSALVRISDGYIVSYVSAVNGTTITVQGRTYTETFTDVVETGETEEVASYTGWIDIGGGSDGGEDGTSIFYGTMDEWNALSTDAKKQYDYMADNDEGNSSIIRPRVMNISNSPINEGEPFYTNVTNSLEVFKIVANAMYADIDTSRILTPYMGHATAYTTDESGEPNVAVSMYIATACWGANGHPYIRMRIFADNDKEYLFARSQDGVFNFAESSSLVDITPIKVNVDSSSGAWVKKNGKVVNINFAALVTLNQTTTSGTILYSGFPKPALDIVRFGLIEARTVDVSTGLFQINSAGNLVADGQGLKSGTAYWGSFTYLTNE